MPMDEFFTLLSKIDVRLARAEERLRDIPEIKREVHEVRELLSGIRVRVAWNAAAIGVAGAAVFEFLLSFLQFKK